MKKRIVALLLAVCLIMTFLPTVAFAGTETGLYSEISLKEGTVGGKQGIYVSWLVDSGSVQITGANTAFAYDPTVFELVDSTGSAVTVTAQRADLTSAQTVNNTSFNMSATENGFFAVTYGNMVAAGFNRSHFAFPLAGFTLTKTTPLGQCFLAYKSGKTIGDVTPDALREAVFAEAQQLGFTYVTNLTTVSGEEINYGSQNGTNDTADWAANVEFGKDFSFAKYDPICEVPDGVSATYGQKLSEIILTNPAGNTAGAWAWKTPGALVGDAGPQSHQAVFTPTDSNTYKTVTAEVSMTVDPKVTTFTVTANPIRKEYTGSALTTTVTVMDGTATLANNVDYTVAFPQDMTNVGEKAISVTGKGNYEGSTGEVKFDITKKNQSTLQIGAISAKTYGDEPFTVPVTGGNGEGAVTVTSSDPTIVKVEGTTATILKTGTVTLTAAKAGDDNFEAATSAGKTITIAQKTITDQDVVVDTLDKTYTGTAITPSAESQLVRDTDYTVTCTNNINVGTATITVAGQGNYKGGFTKNFKIVPKLLVIADFVVDTDPKEYTGGQIKPTVTSDLILNTDYTVTYGNNVDAGLGSITIEGKGNYTGNLTESFPISKIAHDNESKPVTVLSSTYDHNAETLYTVDLSYLIAPGGSLKADLQKDGAMVKSAVLNGTSSLDITVIPAPADTEATVTATVTGCTNYEEYTIEVKLTSVNKKSATVTLTGKTVTYNGNAQSLTAAWPTDGTGITQKTITYVKNGQPVTEIKVAGTYNVTAVYENETHYGKAEATLVIEPKEVTLKWGTAAFTYDGNAKQVTATASGLISGDSCTVTVTHAEAIDAGNYTATATALSNANYKLPAAATKDFVINPRKITFAVSLSPAEGEYTAQAHAPAVVVMDGQKTLTAGEDYTVTMAADMTTVGTKTITVAGMGNYQGSTGRGTYTVTKISQADLVIEAIPAKAYGDEAFTITVTGGSGEGTVTITSSDPRIVKVEGNTATILKAGTVTLTAKKAGDTNYKEAATAYLLTVTAKPVSAAVIALPDGYTPAYNKAAHTPAIKVTLNGTVLNANTDYTVAYNNNTNAGTASVTVTGKGNYTGTCGTTFEIAKASISGMTPAISGVKQVGKTLTGSLMGVDSGEVAFAWYRGQELLTGEAAYTTTEVDSNAELTLKVTAKEVNYTGEATASAQIAKMAISGTLTITETNGSGTDGVIDLGDTLTAVNTAILPGAAQNGTYQWYRGSTAIENATTVTYTVTVDDAGKTIKVVFTPNENYSGTTEAAVAVGKVVLSGTLNVTGTNAVNEILTATMVGSNATEADYTIEWYRDGSKITTVTGANYTLTSADQGKDITAKAIAKGETFTGEVASADAISVPAAAPDAVAATATASSGTVTLKWSAPADNGSAITGYLVQMEGESEITLDVNTTTYKFTGLTNGTEYTFTVKAVNAIGTGAECTVKATPKVSALGGFGGGSASSGTTYVLTFVTNGGTEIAGLKKVEKAVVDLETYIPTKEGFTFEGWYEDPTLTRKVTSVTMTADFSVYAKWTENKTAADLPFTDVAAGDWFYENVKYVYEKNIMNGLSATQFGPKMQTNRAMVVTMLYRLEGQPETTAAAFRDVAETDYFAKATAWAAANGIVTGYNAETFGPLDPVTREQMVTILHRYAKHKGYDVSVGENTNILSYTDAATISEYAIAAMQWACGAGVINGKTADTLDPTGNALRSEIAAIFMRFVELTAK